MNVLHLDTYTLKSNLSWPHYQMHKELLKRGHNSMIISAKGDIVEKDIAILNRGSLLPYFGISRFVRKVFFEILMGRKNYFFPEWNLDLISVNQIIDQMQFKPDIIITYWTEFAFNQKLIYKLSKHYSAPVLSYMLDMAPYTGGCHYAFECRNYEDICGNCPALNSKKKNDLSRKTWLFKRKYIEMTDISYLAGTINSLDQARNSSLLKGKNINKLMISVDDYIFAPKELNGAKTKLGILNNRKVIFFGAASLTEERKGVSYLIEALKMVSNRSVCFNNKAEIVILIAGNKIENIEIPFEYIYLGYLNSQEELAGAYQACDVFVCPSIEDSGPMMINQAIMCGRPVVSFDMGVAPDLVHTGLTGYRAELRNSNDLALGIETILNLDNDEWNQISLNCRTLGVKTCATSSLIDRIEPIILSRISNKHNQE